jgi:hypothetical protein
VIAAAARRFGVLLLTVGVGTAVVGSLLGLVTGGSARRGAALGLYAVGAFCTVMGAGLVVRNSLQLWRPGGLDPESTEPPVVDRELAGLLIALGLVLVVAGIAVDPRAELV